MGVVGDSEIVTRLGEKFLKIFFAVDCRSAGQKMVRSRFHPMKSGVKEGLKPQKRRRKTGENFFSDTIDTHSGSMLLYAHLCRPASLPIGTKRIFGGFHFLCAITRKSLSPTPIRLPCSRQGDLAFQMRRWLKTSCTVSIIIDSPCFDRDEWKRRVCEAFENAPTNACFDLAVLMGVPADHATSPLWV